ncbi:MAG: cytochrome C [Rhodocyclaceae bacterium]|nr:cytochrome C [Rhodocyclaceae bacterium]
MFLLQRCTAVGITAECKCDFTWETHVMQISIIKAILTGFFFCLATATASHAADEADAMKLLEDSKCLKCHSVDKKKDGPAYKEVAAKYKGKAEAEEKLSKHVTVPSKVKVDGEEEEHGSVKTRDADRIRNLVQWILSR